MTISLHSYNKKCYRTCNLLIFVFSWFNQFKSMFAAIHSRIWPLTHWKLYLASFSVCFFLRFNPSIPFGLFNIFSVAGNKTGNWPDANNGSSAADSTATVVLSSFSASKSMHHWNPDHWLRLQFHPLHKITHLYLHTVAHLGKHTRAHIHCTIGVYREQIADSFS